MGRCFRARLLKPVQDIPQQPRIALVGGGFSPLSLAARQDGRRRCA
jgi:hypothetical protein